MRTTRTTLGAHFTEGARLTWLALREREWTATDLRAMVKARDGEPVGGGTVDRWLYGDQLPGPLFTAQIETLLGVPAGAWGRRPTRRFVLEAARRVHRAPVRSPAKPRNRRTRSASAA